MSQARVTDFFTQRKRGDGSTCAKGPKGQQRVADNGHSAFGLTAARPKTRSTRSKNIETISIKSSASSVRETNPIEEEFLRVIEEATGSFGKTQVESRPGNVLSRSDSTELQKPLPASPRTPKRAFIDTEFDIGAAVFTTTADHSSAKKRLRLEAKKEAPVQAPLRNPVKKTARKKLILSRDNEKATQPQFEDVVETPSSPSPLNKECENADKLSPATPSRDQATTQKAKQAKKTLSKDDVSALKARLQKIKSQAEKLTPSAAPAPSPQAQPTSTTTSTESRLTTQLARARELAARAQRRKEDRAAEEPKPAEDQPSVQDGASAPGYQRYHSLAQSAPPSLCLPYQYKLLAEMFRSMDTIVGILYNRSETVTFAKVKQAVEDMMHKRFEESHVGQIRTVYPSAYSFRQERNIPNFSTTAKKGSYQLTVEPAILTEKNARPSLTASLLLERRQTFHQNLVAIVKEHHKVFLLSLSPAISVPEDRLTRWHPRFQVDQVPLVQPSPLPQPPQTEALTTAQQVLDRARSIMTPKMEKALANMALRTAESAARGPTAAMLPPQPPSATTTAPTATPVPQTPSALKGVSQSLLERIRAKEAQKLQAAMTRNPEQERRLLMMSRLSELARILRNVFVAEKKQALIMELACNRMVASYRSALSSGEMEKHLRLLADLVPDWLKVLPVRKDFYLKLNKAVELNVVLEKINQKMREEERL
ncbi:DNA replication factor Cdt1 [Aplochiton taeniatus]